MGYSPASFDYLISLSRKSWLRPGASVLELGAQEVNLDVSPDAVFRFCHEFQEASPDYAEMLSHMPGGSAGYYLQRAGFAYKAIDLWDGPFSVKLDLNGERIGSEYREKFDLVTNFGTSEHVCNQANVFNVVHDSLKVGGCAVHIVPFHGHFNHGLINYHPRFFFLLALENDYEILEWKLLPPNRFYRIPHLNTLPGSEAWSDVEHHDGNILFVCRKTRSSDFVVPTDRDMRQLPRDIDASIKAGVSQYIYGDNSEEIQSDQLNPPPLPNQRPTASQSETQRQFLKLLSQVTAACREHGLGAEPYVLALCRESSYFQNVFASGEATFVPRSLLDQAAEAAALGYLAQSTEPLDQVDLGHGFLGTGWGPVLGDGPNNERRWRWIVGTAAVVYLKVPPGRCFEVRGQFHDAKPGDAIHLLRAWIDDTQLEVKAFVAADGEHWFSARLPKSAVPTDGLIRLRLVCGDDIPLGTSDGISPRVSLRKILVAGV